jgi:hypothetical protein
MQGGWPLGWINLTFVTDLNEARDYLSRCQSKKLSWLDTVSLWSFPRGMKNYLSLHIWFFMLLSLYNTNKKKRLTYWLTACI